MLDELTINKRTTSKERRKLKSISDIRTSSICLGSVAGAVLVATFGIMVLNDARRFFLKKHWVTLKVEPVQLQGK